MPKRTDISKILIIVSLQLLLGSAYSWSEINFEGYQLNHATMQMISVVYPKFQGTVLCGEQSAVDAKIELIELQDEATFKFPDFPRVLKITSDNRGIFNVSVSRGDWKLIVYATCAGQSSHAERVIRVTNRAFIAPPDDRELVIDAKQGKVVIKNKRAVVFFDQNAQTH